MQQARALQTARVSRKPASSRRRQSPSRASPADWLLSPASASAPSSVVVQQQRHTHTHTHTNRLRDTAGRECAGARPRPGVRAQARSTGGVAHVSRAHGELSVSRVARPGPARPSRVESSRPTEATVRRRADGWRQSARAHDTRALALRTLGRPRHTHMRSYRQLGRHARTPASSLSSLSLVRSRVSLAQKSQSGGARRPE